eukprot:6469040-Amphidinium_carterae.2
MVVGAQHGRSVGYTCVEAQRDSGDKDEVCFTFGSVSCSVAGILSDCLAQVVHRKGSRPRRGFLRSAGRRVLSTDRLVTLLVVSQSGTEQATRLHSARLEAAATNCTDGGIL